MRHDIRNMVGALVDIGIGNHQQYSRRRTFYQPAGSLEHGDTGAFGPDQRAGHIETIFGQQEVEVVARNPPRNIGIALAHEIGILVAKSLQAGVDFSAPPALTDDLLRFSIAGLACFYPQPVVGEDLKSFNIVVGLSRHDGMHAAGVVADHAAEGAAVVAGRVGPECQMMFLGGVAQMVEHHSGLHPRSTPLRIDFQDVAHVAGEIQHQRHVAALPGQRGPAATAKEGRAILARQRDRGDNVIGVAGKNHTDRYLAIVGAVGGIEGAAAGIETDVAANVAAQGLVQRGRVHLGTPGGAGDGYVVVGHFLAGVGRAPSPADFDLDFENPNSTISDSLPDQLRDQVQKQIQSQDQKRSDRSVRPTRDLSCRNRRR